MLSQSGTDLSQFRYEYQALYAVPLDLSLDFDQKRKPCKRKVEETIPDLRERDDATDGKITFIGSEKEDTMWSTLPLKKRPLRESQTSLSKGLVQGSVQLRAHNQPTAAAPHSCPTSVSGYSHRSFSPTCSECSLGSIDSGFSDERHHNRTVFSPLFARSCSQLSFSPKTTSPEIFRFNSHSASGQAQAQEKVNCEECGKKFESGVRYKAHLRRHSSKTSGRYQCAVCEKTFVQRSSLTTHQRIHSGERPFQCHNCAESFGDFSTFTKHKRIHTGERPYGCPACGRFFSQSGNMHRHLKAVHGSRTRP